MSELLTATSLFAIVLTLGAYEFGIWLQKKLKHAGFYSENELLVAQMNKDTVYMQEKGGKKCCTIRVK